MYSVTDEGMKWLEDHNCEWVKVEANPGDLIICKSSEAYRNQIVASLTLTRAK